MVLSKITLFSGYIYIGWISGCMLRFLSFDSRKKTLEPKLKKAKTEKKVKKGKDPNLPKRPPTAFFLFM